MRGAIPKFTTIALFIGAAGLFVLGHPGKVRAQTIFCPPPFTLAVNGSCVDPGTTNGAFSGAAVASQALSSLSETTTQETTTRALRSVAERRDLEMERCPAGFSRADGTCQRIPARVTEAVPAAPEERVLKKAKKAKVAAVPHKEAAAPAAKIVPGAAPPAMVCKDGPCAPPFVPIEPAVRLGTWTQVYGDYDKRNATGSSFLTCCNLINPAGMMGLTAPVPLALTANSRTGTVGFLAGADLTSRGVVFGNDGIIVGVTAGYVSSDLTLNTSSVSSQSAVNPGGNSVARLHAKLSGPSAGLYATYFNGGFSSDVTLRIDALRLNENFTDVLQTTSTAAPDPATVTVVNGGSANLLNATIAGNLNYRFNLYPNFWIEPTVGALYTNSSYGSGAAQLGLADGNLVRVQGGTRFGSSTFINDRVLMTTTLTGLAYNDVLVAGGFIPVGAFQGNNLLVQANEGFMRGRGILALNLDYGNGISSFVQGEVRGGAHLFGAGGRAGVRVVW